MIKYHERRDVAGRTIQPRGNIGAMDGNAEIAHMLDRFGLAENRIIPAVTELVERTMTCVRQVCHTRDDRCEVGRYHIFGHDGIASHGC